MGLTNAEKQAAYRQRYAENKARVAELEAEVERLKRKLAIGDTLETPKSAKPVKPGDGGLATGYCLFDDIDAKVFQELVEQQIVDGKASPAAVHQLGGNLQWMGEAYWGRDGKFGPRKRMTFEQKTDAIQRRREAAKKRQAKMLANG